MHYYCGVMLKPSFDIVPEVLEEESVQNATLLLEIGDRLFAAMLLEQPDNRLIALKYFNMDPQSSRSMTEFIAEILAAEPLLARKYARTIVIYSFAESNLLPKQFINNKVDRALTQLIHGNVQKGLILQENVPGKDIVNVFRVSKELQAFVEQQFNPSEYCHAYSLLAANEPLGSENLVRINFYTDRFIATVWKEKNLQLIQNFLYQSPEDVSYQLLAISEQFEIAPDKMSIEVNGFLDEQSALYKELSKFFLDVKAGQANHDIDTGSLLEEYPLHYFSPMLNFAVCV